MKLQKLQKILRESDQLPYVVFNLKNIRYLTGFQGSSAFLMVDENETYFITDSRYEIYAKSILGTEYFLVLQKKGVSEAFSSLVKEKNIKRIYLESSSLNVDTYEALKKSVPGTEIITAHDHISEMRVVKTDDEVSVIQKAVDIADRCIDYIIDIVNPDMTEWELSAKIDSFYKINGCRRNSFDSIVASGAGSAMPHYLPSFEKKIGNDSVLMVDMGCEFNDYCSDITRTFFIGNVPEKFMEIYRVVLDAQVKAIEAVSPGKKCCDVDSVARDYIKMSGYGDFFGHSLGHGVGMDVHEHPYIKADNQEILKSGSIITIEPGIYIEGEGGVRIEDMILVTENGHRNLTGSSKEIIIL